MKLIIISGPSTTGKTTLARRLSKDLDIPTFQKDEFKEQQYDQLPKTPNLRQLKQIDNASRTALFDEVRKAITEDRSLIVESNFLYSERPALKKLLGSNCTVIEIFCRANGFEVLKRYVRRNHTGQRHSGHRDHLWYAIIALEALGPIKLRYRPFRLSPQVKVVDTNDFSQVDYSAIRAYVARA